MKPVTLVHITSDLSLTRVCLGYQSKSAGMSPSRAQSSSFAHGTRTAHGGKVGRRAGVVVGEHP